MLGLCGDRYPCLAISERTRRRGEDFWEEETCDLSANTDAFWYNVEYRQLVMVRLGKVAFTNSLCFFDRVCKRR